MFGWVIVSRQLHFHIYYLFVAVFFAYDFKLRPCLIKATILAIENKHTSDYSRLFYRHSTWYFEDGINPWYLPCVNGNKIHFSLTRNHRRPWLLLKKKTWHPGLRISKTAIDSISISLCAWSNIYIVFFSNFVWFLNLFMKLPDA
jgi:hypothetical protein